VAKNSGFFQYQEGLIFISMATSIKKYAELRCRTNYSFLTGASHPHELIETAAKEGLSALAITDLNGVYGIPKAYLEAKKHSQLKLIVGAEVRVEEKPPLVFLAKDRKGYGLLCRMLTAAHAGKEKGDARLEWNTLLQHLDHPAAQALIVLLPDTTRSFEDYEVLKKKFQGRIYLCLNRFLDGFDEKRTETALGLRQTHDIPIVATNDVHYHTAARKPLQDTISAIRLGTTLKEAGRKLHSNAERYIKTPEQMHKLFSDLPEAIQATLEIAEQCTFSPSELRYYYPSEWIPTGETAQSWLEALVWKGTADRYPSGVPDKVSLQLKHELKLIKELQFADYFLTLWEIVDFARSRNILCQGRGSAANSAVCYCLGITAVDPVRMNLLFERFLSAERGEPPDIDIDFEHERREEVIQHIYEKYGRNRAAMVAAVVTYRSRSCRREISKTLEVPLELAKEEPRVAALSTELHGFPRHLSIHSGGFTLSRDPIIETVPVEPARMGGRTIVQWDKNDLDALGLLKIDVLSLGMLTAIRKTCDLVGGGLTLATIPAEDTETYKMIGRADTVGTFQIESRAQMNMLGRLQPKTYYDLVIQVAIVRPGPIVGKMVHPYLKRRRGIEPVEIPHPDLKPILAKTLGVPLFQEQIMRIAISLARFTPGEADELRRAIGAWRSSGSITKMGAKLKRGLLESGLPEQWVMKVFEWIKGFAEYGFPESHSASFALLAYASAYLKCHYPGEFACALINSQPMGFYAPHTIVDDAKRHGVQVLPLHPNFSAWDCTLEEKRLRIGWRTVKGLSRSEVEQIISERSKRPFISLTDFCARTNLRPNVLECLALGDAFSCFGIDQRHALWEILSQQVVLRAETSGQLSLFAQEELLTHNKPVHSNQIFPALDPYAAIIADYSTYRLSTKGHPMATLRAKSRIIPRTTAADAKRFKHGELFSIAGLVIIRQSPPTAKGTVFATLEDESGFTDLIFHKKTYERYEDLFLQHSLLYARGVIQRDRESVSLLVQLLRPVLN